MSFTIKRMIYEALPVYIKQKICLIPFSLLAGKSYRETYKRLSWIDSATRKTLLEYQEQKLGIMLNFAVEQVPAYRNFRSTVKKYKPFEALQAFPLLQKDTIQNNPQNYLPINIENIPHYETTTGGTSGNQLKIFLDDNSQSIEMGFIHRQWQRVGYSPRHRKATFRGVSFPNLKPKIFWQHNPIYNELQFSPFHMSEKNLEAYVEQIINYAPSFFEAYPSALDVLAEYVLRHGLTTKMPPINAALLGSEETTPDQRYRIERAFRTRVFSWYGHSERLILAGECEINNTYHHFPDYGILEIIDKHGNACNKSGDRGELIGTALYNRCMPLIRYRTGDYATRLEPRCECGREWDRFCDVQGRWDQDRVIGKNGTRISVAALNMHGPLFDKVKRYQYYQDIPGVCILKIMPSPKFTENDRLAIESAYQQKVGDELSFSINIVEDIPLTNRGKLKMLDSKLLK